MKTYIVYILECRDSSYYIGVTNNLERRVTEHSEGKDPNAYTFTRRPVKLVFTNTFNSVEQAIAFEKQIKRWSRAKKKAMIDGEWEKLNSLAECKNDSHFRNKKE